MQAGPAPGMARKPVLLATPVQDLSREILPISRGHLQRPTGAIAVTSMFSDGASQTHMALSLYQGLSH